MAQRTVVVGSKVGLHARPASLFVQAAAKHAAAGVTICKPGGEPAPAASILSILALDAKGGEEVVLAAEGEGAEAALDELVSVLETDHDAVEA
jgi:phosphocarrier protein